MKDECIWDYEEEVMKLKNGGQNRPTEHYKKRRSELTGEASGG